MAHKPIKRGAYCAEPCTLSICYQNDLFKGLSGKDKTFRTMAKSQKAISFIRYTYSNGKRTWNESQKNW